jgi:aarF domain-containing kinase
VTRAWLVARVLVRATCVLVVAAWYLLPALPRRKRTVMARRACRAVHVLGSTYLKFGQIVASSPGLVGADIADAFRSCLDTGPPIGRRALRKAVERAAGRPIEEAYLRLDEAPIGTASIAVVHRAMTAEGRDVAVKVRRPGIRARVATDVAILRGLALAAMRWGKSADAAQMLDMVDDLDRNLKAELDFVQERESIARIGARLEFHGFARIAAPVTYPDLSDDAVLVMEFFEGVAIDDADGIRALGVDAAPLVDDVIKAWLVTSTVDGDFHGDCHAGNLIVRPDGTLGLIDWGIVGRLDDEGRRCVLRLLEGGLGDASAWRDVAEYFLEVLGDALLVEAGATREELPAILEAMMRPLLTAPFGESSLGEFLAAAKERSEVATAKGGTEAMGAARDESVDSPFVQGFFLWCKQLVYFERYARLHGRTRSIASYATEVLPVRPGTAIGP